MNAFLLPGFLAVAAEADDIRDIRSPVSIPQPWWVWLGWLALAAALAAAAWFFWKKFKTARQTPLPWPEDTALARIDAARTLMNAAQARAFSIEVSDALRVYLRDCLGMQAPRKTTQEFLQELVLSNQAVPAPSRQNLEEFLGLCDLAKFARQPLSQKQMEQMLESARAFVKTTAPSRAPESAPAKPI